jgi:hypothetical protein
MHSSYYCAAFTAVILSSISQLMLKMGADAGNHKNNIVFSSVSLGPSVDTSSSLLSHCLQCSL